jgi:PAS domain S-box-containing protein
LLRYSGYRKRLSKEISGVSYSFKISGCQEGETIKKINRFQEIEKKYRILVENMGEGLLVLDKDMLITFVNDRLCETWGYSKDEILGKEVCYFFEGMSKKIIKSEFKKRTRGKSSTYTLAGKTKDGKELFFSVSAVPFIDRKGKFNGSIAIISDITEREKLEKKLKEHSIELEKEVEKRTDQLVDLYKGVAVTEERNRLALEIHGGLAQTLATSLLKIELCERLLNNNPEEVKRELWELRNMLARSIKETRHVIFELSLPKVHRMGFTTVLKQYVEEFCKKTGIVCNLDLKLEESFSTRIQVGIYRIIREAMNNVRKHAEAKHVDMRLRTDKDGHLHLIIKDDGEGFELKRAFAQNKYAKNFGLKGMEEQAKLLGGTFTVESAKRQGTKIKVKVPLEE